MTPDELLKRLEGASEGSRGLDGRIAWVLGWRFNGGLTPDDHDWDEWTSAAGHWHQPDDTFADIDDKAGYRKGFAEGRWDDPPEWTASIDAALALVERVLPGAEYEISTIYSQAYARLPLNGGSEQPCEEATRKDGNVPLAILIALLRALIRTKDLNDGKK